ncbi:MAG: DUF16 domain-containing protein [Brumimicrobium sp.]|nr:DUF16 domain-containing protein [Brumimicrobium sp.]
MKLFCIQLVTTLAIITGTFNLQSQTVQPVDDSVKHEGEWRPCLKVNLDPETKTVKKAWKSFLKDEYDFKIKGIGFLTNRDLLSKEGVVIEKISSKKLDFYTLVEEDAVGSEMKVFAAFGYDIYVNQKEHEQAYRAMKEMLVKFLKGYLPQYYKDQVKETEKRVKKLEKEIKGLNKDITKSNEKIKDLNEEVKELSEEVNQKESDLEVAKTKLQERKKKLERIKAQLNSQ